MVRIKTFPAAKIIPLISIASLGYSNFRVCAAVAEVLEIVFPLVFEIIIVLLILLRGNFGILITFPAH